MTSQERYLRDPLPVRLGNLASNLTRIASCSQRPSQLETVLSMLDESKHFIEWTGPEAAVEVQPELARLQVELARWQLRKDALLSDPLACVELSQAARDRAEQVLKWSGLLET